MAFDGIVVANIVHELKEQLQQGRIAKIAQPEADELLLTIRTPNGQKKLCLSASASLPLVYLTETGKPSPMTAPNFCMLLRKHIGSGRIVEVSQPNFERIINFSIEHLDELGDLRKKELIVEIMGKHSNIIFCDEKGMIIDSIKHVSSHMSSVREVLPGRDYFIPDTREKVNPLPVEEANFMGIMSEKPMPLVKAIFNSFTGVSPIVAEEICHRAGLDSLVAFRELTADIKQHLFIQFQLFFDTVKEGEFAPTIYYQNEEPRDFSSVSITHFREYTAKEISSASKMVEKYYATKNTQTRIRQKSIDLRRNVQTILERNRKKYDLQMKQLEDTEKRDKYKVYGELIHTYGYNLEEGAKELEALNYYDNTMIKIPLDTTLTAMENAQRYFAKYNKQKRTFEALSSLIKETKASIEYLESIQTALDIAEAEDDLTEIKEELIRSGYMKRKVTKGQKVAKQHKVALQKVKIKSKPWHYLSSDGFDMYVGKNNLQNDEITFKLAVGNDWWFHVKGAAGSHVILKSKGEEIPKRTFEEAGKLAVYYSSMREAKKAEVDYVERKHVKKPKGGMPGFVVYYTNYSMVIDGDIRGIKEYTD